METGRETEKLNKEAGKTAEQMPGFKMLFSGFPAVMLGIAFAACVLLTIAGGTLFSGKRVRCQQSFMDVFDTVSMLVIYEKDEKSFEAHYSDVHSLLEQQHRLFDIYHTWPGINNLCTINASAAKGPVSADPELLRFLKWGKAVYAMTDGRVNIAYGAVLELWHQAREENRLPDPEALEKAGEHVSIDAIVIDEAAGTVFFSDPELKLDVGGIAKGYAAERAAELLTAAGVDSALLNLGGNVRAIGSKRSRDSRLPKHIGGMALPAKWTAGGDEACWQCTVEDPFERDRQSGIQTDLRAGENVFGLSDASLVTSGDYERYMMADGRRYCHIIDVETGYPAAYHRSVTVKMTDSGLADALSTALFTMPCEEGEALIDAISRADTGGHAEVLWIEPDGTVRKTG